EPASIARRRLVPDDVVLARQPAEASDLHLEVDPVLAARHLPAVRAVAGDGGHDPRVVELERDGATETRSLRHESLLKAERLCDGHLDRRSARDLAVTTCRSTRTTGPTAPSSTPWSSTGMRWLLSRRRAGSRRTAISSGGSSKGWKAPSARSSDSGSIRA